MRVLIEPSGYKLGNLGDAAMLVASVRRLRELWPEAELAAVTRAPDALAELCPGVEPLEASARSQFLRAAATMPLALLRRELRDTEGPLAHFLQVFDRADLLFVSGAGGLTDAFRGHALTTLDLIEIAQRNGKATALAGQGLGPWDNDLLRARAKEVLPHARALFLREKSMGEGLARKLTPDWGDRLRITGDDALEMAHLARPAELGDAIGVNLRLADYGGVPKESVGRLGDALRRLSSELQGKLLPAPVSHPPNSSDPAAIAELIGGDGGEQLTTTEALIRQIGLCRLVVTGSYHAAVFALAQGVPVVGLVASPYYAGKFEGLHDLFGESCMPLPIEQTERLSDVAASLWKQADERRTGLLGKASHWVAAGDEAYAALSALIAPRARPAAAKPRVSIVIPVFNQAEFLAKCLDSVAAQTCADWEAIVVDDCSTDAGPAAVVAARGDERVRMVQHQSNRGLAAARNTGFREATADWVLPLDADDLIEPVYLEALLDLSEQQRQADALLGRVRYFDSQVGLWRTEAQDAAAFLQRKRLPGAGVLWRKKMWEAVGGYCEDEILRAGQEDTDFWLAAFSAGARTASDPRQLYWYRRHPVSMTGTIPKNYHRIRKFLYRRHRSLIDAHGRPGQFLADGYWRSALSRWRAGGRALAMLFVARATWEARKAPGPAMSSAALQKELERGAWYYPAYQRGE